MSDKLEALSQPVAWTDAEELAEMNAGTYADMFNGKHIQTDDGQWIALYSQEYVTALLAALKEKDQQLARYSISAGQADQRLCESRAVRIALGFGEDAIDVAPTDLVEAIQVIRRRAEEAEQRLQQPIKLPKSGIGMACEFVGDQIVVSLAAVMVEAATAGFKAEVEGE